MTLSKARRRLAAFVALAGILGFAEVADGASLRITERIVVNAWTGLAIDGFDPVAYFADAKPAEGRTSYEVVWSGVAWHFSSAANRQVFLDNPAVYAPRFGGYDPVMVADGAAVPGDPNTFAVVDERLYLFRTAENRDKFLSSEDLRAAADRRWPAVEATLAP